MATKLSENLSDALNGLGRFAADNASQDSVNCYAKLKTD